MRGMRVGMKCRRPREGTGGGGGQRGRGGVGNKTRRALPAGAVRDRGGGKAGRGRKRGPRGGGRKLRQRGKGQRWERPGRRRRESGELGVPGNAAARPVLPLEAAPGLPPRCGAPQGPAVISTQPGPAGQRGTRPPSRKAGSPSDSAQSHVGAASFLPVHTGMPAGCAGKC